jgi:hypothetical protein
VARLDVAVPDRALQDGVDRPIVAGVRRRRCPVRQLIARIAVMAMSILVGVVGGFKWDGLA